MNRSQVYLKISVSDKENGIMILYSLWRRCTKNREQPARQVMPLLKINAVPADTVGSICPQETLCNVSNREFCGYLNWYMKRMGGWVTPGQGFPGYFFIPVSLIYHFAIHLEKAGWLVVCCFAALGVTYANNSFGLKIYLISSGVPYSSGLCSVLYFIAIGIIRANLNLQSLCNI